MAMYGYIDQLSAGTKYGSQRTDVTEPYEAESALGFGKAAFGYKGDPDTATNIFTDQNTITLSTDLITGNIVAVSVNGVAISPVTFDTDHDTTMGLVVAAILALDPDYKAVAAGDVITVTTPGVDVVLTAGVTGGASQPTVTIGTAAASADMVFLGPVIKAQKAPTDAAESVVGYIDGETLEVMRSGYLTVVVDDIANCSENTPVYVILSGDDKGKFTGVAGSNLLINASFHFLGDKSQDLAVVNFQGLPVAVA